MIELVVFDMAGTTVDEDNVVYKTVREAVVAAGCDVSLATVLSVAAGKEKSEAIRDVLNLDGRQHPDEEIASIFQDFKKRLAEAYEALNVTEQSGATETFQQLHQLGVRVALNTGYDRATAVSLIEKLNWRAQHEFDVLVTASDVDRPRPAPDMIQYAMHATNVTDASRVAKVGDSRIDIDEGKEAGCGMTVGITTGAQNRDQLLEASPSHLIDSLAELIDLIRLSS